MDKKEIIKWLKYDLTENLELKKELTNAMSTKEVDKVIKALEEAIRILEDSL